MRSWHNGNTLVRLCSGRLARRTLCVLFLAATIGSAQAPQSRPAAKKVAVHRANEFTLAGLRPGRDDKSRAVSLYKEGFSHNDLSPDQSGWLDGCRHLSLILDLDEAKKIQVIRVAHSTTLQDCVQLPPSPWKTGLGLRVGDSTVKLAQLYGPPDSKSPSTRDGQPLELWYYAFDWAGPDVPQVMEVLCTREQNGQPGHVVEITLAAPSL
jgi:hypothetical protein